MCATSMRLLLFPSDRLRVLQLCVLRLRVLGLLAILLTAVGCDRGADTEISAARRFADAVTRNLTASRDSLIATPRLQELFDAPYVSSDMIRWFNEFYDFRTQHFLGTTRADVDRDLSDDLKGGLKDTNAIESTGMVRIKPERKEMESIYFWMVKQQGHPWRVAMVTKGELQVHFK